MLILPNGTGKWSVLKVHNSSKLVSTNLLKWVGLVSTNLLKGGVSLVRGKLFYCYNFQAREETMQWDGVLQRALDVSLSPYLDSNVCLCHHRGERSMK